MLCRVYDLVRVATIYSPYMADRSQRLCSSNGIRASIFYATRCLFIQHAFPTVAVLLVTGVMAFGYCLRVFERPLDGISGFEFGMYSNTFWCVIVTMTTVGYGDYFPATFFGRFVGFVACIYGVFVLSLGMVLLGSSLHTPQ